MSLRPIKLEMQGILTWVLCTALAGCMNAPGKPPLPTEARPEQVLTFATLYRKNCAACHGANGKGGAAISMANPAYLATAGVDTLRNITSNGVKGTLMPGFGKAAGGMLTDQQINILALGMVDAWGSPSALGGASPLPYAARGMGDVTHGQAAYANFCAGCHGAGGTGVPGKLGSIVDPAYLALISDQELRSIVIAGWPDVGMGMPGAYPHGSGSTVMNDQQITDIVAWLASHRTATPGAPYPQRM